MFYVRINTFRHHFNHGAGHILQHIAVFHAAALQKFHDFGDILRLVADALHVGDHLQRRGNLPEIPGHGLLLQKQLQAQRFDVALLLVDFRIQGRHLFGHRHVPFQHRPAGHGDDLFAQGAHLDEFPIQLGQLLIQTIAHYPNLPVM